MADNEQDVKELPAPAIEALSNGRKIEAVKIVRREWNMDLKEAKDAVDDYLSKADPSQRPHRAPGTEPETGRFPGLVLVVIVVAAGYYLWKKF